MQYRITHTTKYAYSESVPICHNKVHLAPRASVGQKCHDYRLLIIPEPTNAATHKDHFGNGVDYFSITEAHLGLSVTATSIVEVTPREVMTNDPTPWECVVDELRSVHNNPSLENRLFTYASEYIPLGSSFANYARESFPRGRSIIDATKDLTRRIFKEFDYDPRATNVSTPIKQVLDQKSGVCQDFAHFQIACLRSMGLAARYVSGYLRTLPPPGKPKLVGADASHAWLSVYCGAAGWIDFDPTNDVIPGTDHITVAYGRDYADVCPIQGVFIGGGDHSMSVSVDVAAVNNETGKVNDKVIK